MKLLDKLRDLLEKGESDIRIRGEISGTNWAEISMVNIAGQPVKLGTPVINMSIRIQTLASGAIFSPQPYRVDNAHGFLHEHSSGAKIALNGDTASCALLAIFGKEYEVLENKGL